MHSRPPLPAPAATQQNVSSHALPSQRLLVAAVAAALHCVGDQNDAQNDHEHDGGQRIDLRADLFTGHGVDGDGQCFHRAAVEIGDHEVVDGIGQTDEECRQDGRADLRQDDLDEGLLGVAAKVERCLIQLDIQLLELGCDVEDDIRHIERDMRNEQRREAHDGIRQPGDTPGKALVGHEQQHERDAGDDLRVDHRDIGDVGDDKAAPAAHGRNAQTCRCTQHSGNDRRDQSHFQRDQQRMQDG